VDGSGKKRREKLANDVTAAAKPNCIHSTAAGQSSIHGVGATATSARSGSSNGSDGISMHDAIAAAIEASDLI